MKNPYACAWEGCECMSTYRVSPKGMKYVGLCKIHLDKR